MVSTFSARTRRSGGNTRRSGTDVARARAGEARSHYLDRAIEDLGASNPLFVGDSNADVGAATAAGIDSAFIRRDHRTNYDLQYEPTDEFQSLAEVAAAFEPTVTRDGSARFSAGPAG